MSTPVCDYNNPFETFIRCEKKNTVLHSMRKLYLRLKYENIRELIWPHDTEGRSCVFLCVCCVVAESSAVKGLRKTVNNGLKWYTNHQMRPWKKNSFSIGILKFTTKQTVIFYVSARNIFFIKGIYHQEVNRHREWLNQRLSVWVICLGASIKSMIIDQPMMNKTTDDISDFFLFVLNYILLNFNQSQHFCFIFITLQLQRFLCVSATLNNFTLKGKFWRNVPFITIFDFCNLRINNK